MILNKLVLLEDVNITCDITFWQITWKSCQIDEILRQLQGVGWW